MCAGVGIGIGDGDGDGVVEEYGMVVWGSR